MFVSFLLHFAHSPSLQLAQNGKWRSNDAKTSAMVLWLPASAAPILCMFRGHGCKRLILVVNIDRVGFDSFLQLRVATFATSQASYQGLACLLFHIDSCLTFSAAMTPTNQPLWASTLQFNRCECVPSTWLFQGVSMLGSTLARDIVLQRVRSSWLWLLGIIRIVSGWGCYQMEWLFICISGGWLHIEPASRLRPKMTDCICDAELTPQVSCQSKLHKMMLRLQSAFSSIGKLRQRTINRTTWRDLIRSIFMLLEQTIRVHQILIAKHIYYPVYMSIIHCQLPKTGWQHRQIARTSPNGTLLPDLTYN